MATLRPSQICREKDKAARGEEKAKEREEREKQARAAARLPPSLLRFARRLPVDASLLSRPPSCFDSPLQKQVEREERERRRAEAAKAKEEARRYPMEDLELLAELQQKAVEDGATAAASCIAFCSEPRAAGVCVYWLLDREGGGGC